MLYSVMNRSDKGAFRLVSWFRVPINWRRRATWLGAALGVGLAYVWVGAYHSLLGTVVFAVIAAASVVAASRRGQR
jgi:hypothetical protein